MKIRIEFSSLDGLHVATVEHDGLYGDGKSPHAKLGGSEDQAISRALEGLSRMFQARHLQRLKDGA